MTRERFMMLFRTLDGKRELAMTTLWRIKGTREPDGTAACNFRAQYPQQTACPAGHRLLTPLWGGQVPPRRSCIIDRLQCHSTSIKSPRLALESLTTQTRHSEVQYRDLLNPCLVWAVLNVAFVMRMASAGDGFSVTPKQT